VIPIAVSWALVLGFAGSGALKFPIVYAVMFLLAYLLITAGKRKLAVSSPVSP
jgi:uncharacterized RDD family membrane protein YckC